VEDLVQKMKIIMDDPDKIRVLGKAANERSVKLFTRKHNAGEIEKVYREICREV
jgi:glycosyltransferase involved in cell wall biosynthesis